MTPDDSTVPPPRRLSRRSLLAAGAGGLGVGVLSRLLTTVDAAAPADVPMLQTAAAIENLMVAVYRRVQTLPAATSGTSIPAIAAFVDSAIRHHGDHAATFAAAARRLGGAAQTGIDQTLHDAVVTPALARLAGPADVLALARTLEDTAAQTYVRFGGDAGDRGALRAFATVAPVEAQHVAVLLTAAALIERGMPQLITVGPAADPARLPAALGSAGFPTAFHPTSGARPAGEGAVR